MNMKVDMGIAQKDRDGVIDILNLLVADESVLYAKIRNYHWHMTGPSFSELHKFLEAQYREVDEIADQIAERTRTLGGQSLATLKEFLDAARIKEPTKKTLKYNEMLADLLSDHESLIVYLRKGLEACQDKFNDAGTTDFLTGIMEQHEKMAWMTRSYLE